MDTYKVNILKHIFDHLNDDYYLCRLHGDDTKSINLDANAVKLLIDYYSK